MSVIEENIVCGGLANLEQFDCPNSLLKIKNKLISLREHTHQYKKEITNIHNDIKSLELLFERYLIRIAKQQVENKANKKPSGFAAPVKITDALCEFMGKEKNSLVSRTEATKFINKYIKEHSLRYEDNKTVIKPDAKLHQLLGTSDSDEIKYFTIQKYLNKHFITKE